MKNNAKWFKCGNDGPMFFPNHDEPLATVNLWNYNIMLKEAYKYRMLIDAVITMTEVRHYTSDDDPYLSYPSIEKILEVIEPDVIAQLKLRLKDAEKGESEC